MWHYSYRFLAHHRPVHAPYTRATIHTIKVLTEYHRDMCWYFLFNSIQSFTLGKLCVLKWDQYLKLLIKKEYTGKQPKERMNWPKHEASRKHCIWVTYACHNFPSSLEFRGPHSQAPFHLIVLLYVLIE